MYMRRWIICVVLLALVLPAYGVNPYPQLEVKAERAFGYGEWASAAAIFDLMLEQKPDVPGTYGRAIVANGMRDATSVRFGVRQCGEMELLSRASACVREISGGHAVGISLDAQGHQCHVAQILYIP